MYLSRRLGFRRDVPPAAPPPALPPHHQCRCLQDGAGTLGPPRDVQATPRSLGIVSKTSKHLLRPNDQESKSSLKIKIFFELCAQGQNPNGLLAPSKPHKLYKTASYPHFNSQKQINKKLIM